MNNKNIFEYSEDFLAEILNDIMKLKVQKLSSPSSNEYENKIRAVVGKNFNETDLKKLIFLGEKEIKEKIISKFKEIRDERIKVVGEDQAKDVEKKIFLQCIDLNWKSHIQYLEQLRQVIGLRSYGQRDPLIEYKKEAFVLFENLLEKLKLDFVTILFNLKVVKEPIKEQKRNNPMNVNQKCLLLIKKNEKISRNDRCEATGKKFKNCCGSL